MRTYKTAVILIDSLRTSAAVTLEGNCAGIRTDRRRANRTNRTQRQICVGAVYCGRGEVQMSGKYDALRDYLISQSGEAGRLTMAFSEIDHLVKQLPQSARRRREWWGNAPDSRVQARAWQGAGWHVYSVDLEGEQVVFARGSVGESAATGRSSSTEPSPSTASAGLNDPGELVRTHPNAESTSKVNNTSDQETSWRSMASDLIAGGVAALAAGVTAIVALTHLPWLAIVLLSIATGAIAFALTQAITLRDNVGHVQKWWRISAAMLIILGAGAFVYHKELDPSTRAPALPFTMLVKPDPSELITPECRTIVLPGPWRNITPPSPMTDSNVNEWAASHHGADGNETAVLIELQGLSDQVVMISQPQVVVTRKKPPTDGTAAQLSGGCGGESENRVFKIDLDQRIPKATLVSGTPYPPLQTGAETFRQASSPHFTISASDPEYFAVIATTKKCFCQWHLVLNWQSMGKSGTVLIENGSAPFFTSAVNPAANAIHMLISGTWVAPPHSN